MDINQEFQHNLLFFKWTSNDMNLQTIVLETALNQHDIESM